MSSLDELYQSLILDHNRRPRNWGAMAGADREERARNPLCGDEVTLWLRLDGDTIADVRFEGVGCAISKASASVMTTAVKGKTVPEAEALFTRFHELVTGRGGETGEGLPSSLRAFAGVARFPVRVKCASMAWHALHAALRPREGGPEAGGAGAAATDR